MQGPAGVLDLCQKFCKTLWCCQALEQGNSSGQGRTWSRKKTSHFADGSSPTTLHWFTPTKQSHSSFPRAAGIPDAIFSPKTWLTSNPGSSEQSNCKAKNQHQCKKTQAWNYAIVLILSHCPPKYCRLKWKIHVLSPVCNSLLIGPRMGTCPSRFTVDQTVFFP